MFMYTELVKREDRKSKDDLYLLTYKVSVQIDLHSSCRGKGMER